MSFEYSPLLADASVIIGIVATAAILFKQFKKWYEKVSAAAVLSVKVDNKQVAEKLAFSIEMSHKCILRLEEKMSLSSTYNVREVDFMHEELRQIKADVAKAFQVINDRSPMFERLVIQLDELSERLIHIEDFQKNHEANDARDFGAIRERLDALSFFRK